MASHLVAQHQLSSYATPINGAAGDATVVLGNDNTTVTGYDSHDADATIHVQDSTAATFAAVPAGTAGRKWMTSDTGAVYLYFDTGSAWVEANYLRNTGGTVSGTVTVTSTTTPQVTIKYDATHYATFTVNSLGDLLIGAGTNGTGQQVRLIGSNMQIGDSSSPSNSIAFAVRMDTSTLTGSGQRGVSSEPIFNSQASVYATAGHFQPVFASGTYTIPILYGVRIVNPVTVAGVSVTTQYGLYIYDVNYGGTNYALYTNDGAISFGAGITVRTGSVTLTSGDLMLSSGAITASGDITGRDMIVGAGRGLVGSDSNRYVTITAGTSLLLGAGALTQLTLNTASALFSANVALSGAATTQSAGVLSIGNTTQSTVGAAGGASALPATPTGYIKAYLGSTQVVIPYYAQA